MKEPRAGYGSGMRIPALVAVVLTSILTACFAESGLRDEVREATDALDRLIDEVGDLPEVRAAAERAMEAADEAQAALEDFREDPSAETRQALEDSARRLEDARDRLDGLLEGVPEAVREGLRRLIDALTDLRREIESELEG
jgi:ABC-type transporter Mla subunit MlaD